MELRVLARCAATIASSIALAACGNRDVVSPPGSASLAVVVTTPIPDAGAVIISGPAAYSRTMAHTDTLRGLIAGGYTARAASYATADSLVSTVLTGVVGGTPVMLEPGDIGVVSSSYAVRGGSGALWVGKWGTVNLAEGFTSPQLAAAGSASPAHTIGAAASLRNISATIFDSAGNMWATDYSNQRIMMFTPSQLVSDVSAPAVTIPTANEPWGMAFDAQGNLWVSFYNGNEVVEYTAAQLEGWSGSLVEPAPARVVPTPIGPLGLAFDASGNLWVAGFDVPMIYEIGASAIAASGAIAPTDSLQSAYLEHASGLAFDRAGNLWAGTESGYVVGYTVAQLADTARGEPELAQPGAYSFDAAAFDNSGNLWMATETADVVMFSPAQLASGNLLPPARTLTAAAGERIFALGFDSHDPALPLASTYSSSGRAPRSMGARRAPPPRVHPRDGGRPGNVRRW